MRPTTIWGLSLLCAAVGALTPAAPAASISFTGTFAVDDQRETFSFVAGPASAILRTWGFAGGVNANGATIAPGGFDPVLSLFGPGALLISSTPLLATNNDGGASVPADPGTGEHFDSFLDTSAIPLVLTPGQTYFLILSVSDNTPLSNTFGGGFSEQGMGNFTGPLYGCGSAPFCDIDVDQRNGHWAVDFTGVASATDLSAASPAPEPGTFGMLTVAGAIGVVMRKKLLRRKFAGV